jgi:beta-galactosidase
MIKAPRLGLALLLALSLAGAARAGAPDAGQRERLLLDFGWKFHLGDEWGVGYGLAKAGTGYGPGAPGYSDASWRTVNLPHDWAIELPFDQKADGSHGFRVVGDGFPQNNVGWYRRSFDLPAADSGKRIWLEFDGAYRDSTVIVNGWFVGHHESGYSGFRYDITDVANCGGRNVVSVRVDASQAEGWFYEGAGIYRHVWLVKTAPVSLAPDGVYVYSRFKGDVPAGPAEVHMQATLSNSERTSADAVVSWAIGVPGNGGPLSVKMGSQAVKLAAASTATVEVSAPFDAPSLWSPEHPVLYTLVTTVTRAGVVVDRVETPFGFRTFAFDANKGFLLNGEPYTLKGTSNHQDHAGVGSALPDGIQYFRMSRLKDMGCNALRTTHNPPTPELLDACDRLGIIVMDENRQLGSDPHHIELLDEQVRRDRNHASVGIWSLGNEEFDVQGTPSGGRVVSTMQAFVQSLDATRPITCNAAVGDEYEGINEAVQVRGWSYHVGKDMDSYHAKHPLQPNVGSEQGSTVSTRGIYTNDPVRGYVAAYDDNAPEWAQTAETWVTFFSTRPWMSGGFVWTGFDYRGEPTPYGWPCINSHFGIMDTCGFAKDNFYYYLAAWTETPMVHVLPHWNWPGLEGKEIDVRAQTNCDEVELFLNGASLGRKAVKRYSEGRWSVPYAPGTLSAKAYRGGKVVAEDQVETTGAPAAVKLAPHRASIGANGEDVAIFTVSVTDAQGRVVPVAGNSVSLSLDGPGRIIGVGNGDPSSHEFDTLVPVSPSRSLPVDGWRWKKVVDSERDDVPEKAVALDDSGWTPVDVRGDAGLPGRRLRAIYRTHLTVTDKDLQADAVELVFARIAGGFEVLVNGKKFGGRFDWHSASVFDVKSVLHAGENVIVVPVANYGTDDVGITKGVTLRLQDAPLPVQWSRSVFNGLAQVIVQSSKEPGTLTLKATADGLAPASFALTAEPAPARPAVP